jgi:hypothetical protein
MYFGRGAFNEEQLKSLRAAFDATCQTLNIRSDDQDRRQQVAHVLLALAEAGQYDVEQLTALATDHCQKSNEPST